VGKQGERTGTARSPALVAWENYTQYGKIWSDYI